MNNPNVYNNETLQLIQETVHYICQNPQNEKDVRDLYENNPQYQFLNQGSPLYDTFISMKEQTLNQMQSQRQQHEQYSYNQHQFQNNQYNISQQQQYQGNYQQPQQSQQSYNMQYNQQVKGLPVLPSPNQFCQMQQSNTQQQYQQKPQQMYNQNYQQQAQNNFQQYQYSQPQLQNQYQSYSPNEASHQNQQQQHNYPQYSHQQSQNNNNSSNIQEQSLDTAQSDNQDNEQGKQNGDEQQKRRKKGRWSQVPISGNDNNQIQVNQSQVPLSSLPQLNQNLQGAQMQSVPLQIKNTPIGVPVPISTSHINPLQNIQIQLSKYQKQITLPESQQLEELDGGLMCEVVKGHLLQQTNTKLITAPYTPIDMDKVPNYVIIQDKQKEMIKAKLEQVEEFLQKEKEEEKKKLQEIENQKLREKEIEQLTMAGIDVEKVLDRPFGKTRDIEREVEELYSNPVGLGSGRSHLTNEMGITQDGRALGGDRKGGLGMGLTQAPSTTHQVMNVDQFANYRKSRSFQYHRSAEERSYTKERLELCYKCNRPGHIAKDCKFGLT